ncbi:MAG TPA: FAD-dependent oxidoreductase [Candidatus Obscuribacterales bacterium]
MKSIGILGGGVAGLSLSYFLGSDTEVLEKESVCGGLCRTYEKDGFTFDLGGHIIFSKDAEILEFELELLKDKVNRLYRRAACWFKGRFVKYPFENGLSVLDKDDTYQCLYHFLNNPPQEVHTFEDWIYNTFGKGLAELYLLPYNRKIWKTPPCEMGIGWVERVPKPPAEDIIKSALGIETEGYTHQLHFYYPKTGGFETLPRTFEEHVKDRIVRDFAVKNIRQTRKGWVVSNGKEEREYERIICAMPIFDFIAALEEVPPEVSRAAANLQYTSLIIVLVGLNRPRHAEQVACHFPQPDIVFHRLVFFDYFGANYVPDGCSSMVAEITARPGDALLTLDDDQIAKKVIDDLSREGFIERQEVVVTCVKRAKYGYPIYDLQREQRLEIINAFCREKGIELCGRFAEFNYYNSDAVIRSAKTVAQRMGAREHA